MGTEATHSVTDSVTGTEQKPPPGGETVSSQADLEKEGLLRRSKMAEEKPRTLKVLEALSKMTEPSSPADIGIVIGGSPRDTGETLCDLGKRDLHGNQTRSSRCG